MSEVLHRALRKIVCEYENSREDAAEVAFAMVDIARQALATPPHRQEVDEIAAFVSSVEPLGAEMEAIWDENRDALYEDAPHRQEVEEGEGANHDPS